MTAAGKTPVRHSRHHGDLVRAHGSVPVVVADFDSRVKMFQDAASATNTSRAYASDWSAFVSWCSFFNKDALPAEPKTVAEYLAYSAELRNPDDGQWMYAPSTLARWVTGINYVHAEHNAPKPGSHTTVTKTLAGIKRLRAGERPPAKKEPLLLGALTHMLTTFDLTSWPAGVIGHRDHAMLLIGFAGGFRRSELAELEIRDMKLNLEDGLHVRVRKSKTDQTGAGQLKGLPFGVNPLTCPPCAYVRWMNVVLAQEEGRPQVMALLQRTDLSKHVCRDRPPRVPRGFERGPLFRPVMKNAAIKDRHISGTVVNAVVKRRLEAVGIPASTYGAHSLRAGFITQAFRNGANHHEVMRQTGQVNIQTVEGYSRDNAPLLHNAVTRFDL